jgi:hypothetical protein
MKVLRTGLAIAAVIAAPSAVYAQAQILSIFE